MPIILCQINKRILSKHSLLASSKKYEMEMLDEQCENDQKIKMAGDMSTMVMKVEDDTIRLRYYYCHYYCYCYYYSFEQRRYH